MTEYEVQDPEEVRPTSNPDRATVQLLISAATQRLREHHSYVKNVYGQELHPSELNDVTSRVNDIHTHLNNAATSFNRDGDKTGQHLSAALDGVDSLEKDWATRSPSLRQEGPANTQGKSTSLWGHVGDLVASASTAASKYAGTYMRPAPMSNEPFPWEKKPNE